MEMETLEVDMVSSCLKDLKKPEHMHNVRENLTVTERQALFPKIP